MIWREISTRFPPSSAQASREAAVLAADPTALVLRTNVVYGPEKVGKNFVYQLVRKLKGGESMNVPEDQVNTPTYNRDLADATKRLIECGASGVLNVGGCEPLGTLKTARRRRRNSQQYKCTTCISTTVEFISTSTTA